MELSVDEPPSYFLFILLNTPLIYSVYGIILVLLLFLSALVSGSEVAFFSTTSQDIEECSNSGRKSDLAIVELLRRPKELLATILILNNLINVAFVTLSTFTTWRIFGTSTLEGKIIVGLTAITTFLIVFFGEIIPKVYATQNHLKYARYTSNFILFSFKILKPISVPLNMVSNFIEKRFKTKGYEVSIQELHHALEIATEEETTEEEKEILKGIVSFGTISVKQIMKSRVDITAIDYETDYHELMDKINKSGFSRIPVYKETIDNIEGILYIKDLLPFIEKDEKFNWQTLLRPGYFVPENKKIDTLLRDFQEKRVHLAIVVDEYGGTSGLITLEDVIEEIVGEINDEFDDEDIHYDQIDANTYMFEGKTSLNDFCKIIDEDPRLFDDVKGDSESLGGLILELNQVMPHTGERVEFNKYLFTVMAVTKKRIKKVKVYIKESSNEKESKVVQDR